ncbi:MAG: DNA internalization-related competence protein ComEC/Rec2 [Bacillota bacterium]
MPGWSSRPLVWVAVAYALGAVLGPAAVLALGLATAMATALPAFIRPTAVQPPTVRSAVRRWGIAVCLAGTLAGWLNAATARSIGRGTFGDWVSAQVAAAAATAGSGGAGIDASYEEFSRWTRLGGRVVGEPEESGRDLRYLVRVAWTETAAGRLRSDGLALVREKAGDRPPAFGQEVLIEGDLTVPRGPGNPGEFDYRAYLERRGVAALLEAYHREETARPVGPSLTGLALALRRRLGAAVRVNLPPTEAALLEGVVFGGSRGLPPEVEKAFRDAGVFHVLAVSGSNVAFVAGAVLWLARRLRARPQTAALWAIGAVWFYALMTGAGASVVRASVMATVVLFGRVIGRPADAANSLAVAGLIILGRSPLAIHEAGFQLSFGATAGLLMFARGPDRFGLRTTGSAQMALMPLTLGSFGQAPCTALISNVVVIPVAGVLVLAGVSASAAASLLAAAAPAGAVVGGLIFLPCRLGLWLMLRTVSLASSLPWAYVNGPAPPAALAFAYYAALLWLAARLRARGPSAEPARASLQGYARMPRGDRALTLAAGFLLINLGAALFVWPRLLPPTRLEVTFLDVGQGDSAVIRPPGGRTIVIDTGNRSPAPASGGRPSPGAAAEGDQPSPAFDAGERVVLPYLRRLGVSRVDLLIITHAHDDHSGGARALIEGIPVSAVVEGPAAYTSSTLEDARLAADDRHVRRLHVALGQAWTFGRDLRLEVESPPDPGLSGTHSDVNNSSLVLRLTYGAVSFLLMGDLEDEGEALLLARGPTATVLKVSHHGSQYSTGDDFLAAVAPRYAVISVGKNSFGHPSPATVARLAAAGAVVLRTDRDGAVTFTTDGRRLTVRAFRRVFPRAGRNISP